VTTVAWKAGEIAADRQADGWLSVGKLFRLKDGSVIGGAGFYDEIVEVVAWINAGAKPEEKPALPDRPDGSDFIIACPDGKAYWLTSPFLRRVELLDPFIAIGTGAKIALGAMAAGASARRAVEIACKYDESTGKGVNSIKVKK
jgi:hypothetical protein